MHITGLLSNNLVKIKWCSLHNIRPNLLKSLTALFALRRVSNLLLLNLLIKLLNFTPSTSNEKLLYILIELSSKEFNFIDCKVADLTYGSLQVFVDCRKCCQQEF